MNSPAIRPLVLGRGAFLAGVAATPFLHPARAFAGRPAPPSTPVPATQPKTPAQLATEAAAIQTLLAKIHAQAPIISRALDGHVHQYPFERLNITNVTVNATNLVLYAPGPIVTRVSAKPAPSNIAQPPVPAALANPNAMSAEQLSDFLPALASDIATLQAHLAGIQRAYLRHTHAVTDTAQGLVAEPIGGRSYPLAIANDPREETIATMAPPAIVDPFVAPKAVPKLYQPSPQEQTLDALSATATQFAAAVFALQLALDTHAHTFMQNAFAPLTIKPRESLAVTVCEAVGRTENSTARAATPPPS